MAEALSTKPFGLANFPLQCLGHLPLARRVRTVAHFEKLARLDEVLLTSLYSDSDAEN